MSSRPKYETHDAGKWLEYTFFDENGEKVQTVAYPKDPMFSETTLRESVADDEKYFSGQH